jgi:RluA family pseudouridine synthase
MPCAQGLLTLVTLARKSTNSYLVEMNTTHWKTNLREENSPLLEALSLRVPAAPLAFLRQLCKKQRVLVDDNIAEAERPVHVGEAVVVRSSQRWLSCLENSRVHPEQVLYEDDQCLVINKPAGMAIHRAQGHDDNLLHRVQDFLYLRGEKFQVAPIHRLDIGTSGAVLFGKGRASISQLGQAIMAGLMTKRYLALVSGKVTLSGELNSAVPAKGSNKESLTRFYPVATTGKYSLLELELVTGRRHQVRYQLAKAGWPIVGDTRYHGNIIADMARPFLHCHHLVFPAPASGQDVDINCPLPPDLRAHLATLDFPPEALSPAITD